MKHILYTLFIVFISTQLMSQSRYFDERYIFTQSYVQPVLVNPGAIGSTPYHTVFFGYRNTWAGFDGTPKTFTLSYDGPIANRLSLGAMVLSDTNGALETTKGQVGLSYSINSPENKVGFGLTGEIVQHSVDAGVLNQNIDVDDPTILSRFDGVNYFDVSFGVFGEYQEKFIYGLALPSLVSSLIDDNPDVEREQEFGYLLQLGYRHAMPQYDMTITPSIMVKDLMFVPLHVDINVLGEFLDDKLSGGITYTVGADERLGFLIGTRLNAFNFFYTYNVSRHEFQQYNNGSHEISVRLDIGRKDKVMMQEEEMMEKDIEQ